MGSVWGPLGVIVGHLYEIWEVYGDPIGVIRGHLYEVWEVFEGHRGSNILGLVSVWVPYGVDTLKLLYRTSYHCPTDLSYSIFYP